MFECSLPHQPKCFPFLHACQKRELSKDNPLCFQFSLLKLSSLSWGDTVFTKTTPSFGSHPSPHWPQENDFGWIHLFLLLFKVIIDLWKNNGLICRPMCDSWRKAKVYVNILDAFFSGSEFCPDRVGSTVLFSVCVYLHVLNV